jgi:chromate transporter
VEKAAPARGDGEQGRCGSARRAASAMSGLDARIWWRIGWLSFGGPAGQIALMQRMLVEELRWLDARRFLSALNFCMLLPGPEAQQLATWIGWTRGGWRGALVAGGLFVLPGMLVMLLLSAAYVTFGRLAAVEALFLGVKCAVVAIVLEALLRIARRALVFRGAWTVALLAFAALHFLALPYPLLVALAAAVGAWRSRGLPRTLPGGPALRTHWGLAAAVAVAWLAPLGLLLALRGASDLLTQLGLLYSELALVTFGGAYAVLAYVGERAVAGQGWLSARQMADGLGLAETTPGPLILVLQFVAFVAAWQSADGGGSYGYAVLASLLAVWCLFLPSFLWIFLGGPHIDRLNAEPRLRGALDHVTAAVVGVIANLSLWFALHVLFGRVEARQSGALHWLAPQVETLDLRALGLVAIAMLLLFGLRWGLLRTLAASAALGLALGRY